MNVCESSGGPLFPHVCESSGGPLFPHNPGAVPLWSEVTDLVGGRILVNQ